MNIGLTTLAVIVVFLIILATGFPIAFGMLTIGVVGMIMFGGWGTLYSAVGSVMRIATLDIFIAIPLFILMAKILEASGVGERLYDTMYKWFGGLKGGLGIGTIAFSTVIAATTGIVATATLTAGVLAYPEMRKRGYPVREAMGPVMAGGALGPLIPPSTTAILISGLTGISTGKLFMTGMIPGLMCSLLFMFYIGIRAYFKPSIGPPIPAAERPSWPAKWRSLTGLIAPLLLVTLVLGGIYAGVVTPTEAGGLGAVGALACAVVFRQFSAKAMRSAVMDSVKMTAMVIWIGFGGAVFSSSLGMLGVNHFVSEFMLGLNVGSLGTLMIMLFILFVLGMVLDHMAIVLICIPIFTPIAITMGWDLLWFNFLFLISLIIGVLTPPFGYALFYAKGLGYKDVTTPDLYAAVWPYVGLMTLVMFLAIAFPGIAVWLPNQMIK